MASQCLRRFDCASFAITIRPDFSRRTPVADPDDHHLFASLGAAAENIVQAAPVFGLATTVHFDPSGEGRVEIALGGGETRTSPLAEAIARRQCTRCLFDGRAVPEADLGVAAAAASGDGVELVLLTQRSAIDAVAELITDGNSQQLGNPVFMAELQRWIRFSYAEALSSGDGLFAKTTGNPALPGPIGRALFKRVVTAGSENKKCLAQIASSAGLGIFVSARNDRSHWFAAGRAYQRFALQTTALGIKHAFLNQAVEVAEVRARLADHLVLEGRRPDLIVRFGYATEMPSSLRRAVGDVVLEPATYSSGGLNVADR